MTIDATLGNWKKRDTVEVIKAERINSKIYSYPIMFRRDGMKFLVASGAAVLLILLPLACARLSVPPAPSKTGTSTTSSDHDPTFDFDFYVFSMSFQPEFCYEHKRDNFDGCRHPNDEWRGALTIHVSW